MKTVVSIVVLLVAAAYASTSVVVTVCRNLEQNCHKNCTDYTLTNDGSCWMLPGDSMSMTFSCDSTAKCIGVKEYLFSDRCTKQGYAMQNFDGHCTVDNSLWTIMGNNTVLHGLNCQSFTTGKCEWAACEKNYTGTVGECSAQSVLGLNSSYFLTGPETCDSLPSQTVTYWVSNNCTGDQKTTHKYLHQAQCADLLPYARATFTYKCVPAGSKKKLPPRATTEIMELLSQHHRGALKKL